METELYKTVTLLGGQEVKIKIARGHDLSRAAFMHMFKGKELEIDVMPFIMDQLCLVDNEKVGIEFYLNLIVDDYIVIIGVLDELLKPIK